jgi:transposase
MTNGRVEVITSVERRRRWSAAEKQRLVPATLELGASVSAIAREAGIHPSQLRAHGRASASRRCRLRRRLRQPAAGDRDRVCDRGSDADHGRGRQGDADGSNRSAGRWTAAMIPLPTGVRVWLAAGHTDMRKGFPSLALQVQEVLHRDPLSGHLVCFRGRRGDLLKVIWHDGQGACLFTKRLERGRFLWPSLTDGVVTISSAQLGYLLSGNDWRHPQETWRPISVG